MKRILTSCFGLGFLPYAPGTFGSLPPAICFAVLLYLGVSTTITALVMAALVAIGFFICIKYAGAAASATGKSDPAEVVADEFSGQAVTFLIICPFIASPFPKYQIWLISTAGLVLFRLFDIFKFRHIKKIEKLPCGLGIVLDDLLAGVYAGILGVLVMQMMPDGYIYRILSSKSMSLSVPAAVFLGLVQGLTEFLPVSSSGHLVLFEHLFGYDAEKPQMLLFDLVIHTATVFAIFIVLYKSILKLLKNLVDYKKYGTGLVEIYQRNSSVRILVLAFITTAVTGPLGIIFEKFFTQARGSLKTVGLMWLITGTVLIITDFRKKGRMGLRQFGVMSAVIIGLAQAIAIMPGISRSGATISAAILVGLHRRWAVEYSFLVGIPVILGATAVEVIKNFSLLKEGGLPAGSLAAGFITAVITGVIAIKILMKVSRQKKLKFFGIYCLLLAIFVLIYYLK